MEGRRDPRPRTTGAHPKERVGARETEARIRKRKEAVAVGRFTTAAVELHFETKLLRLRDVRSRFAFYRPGESDGGRNDRKKRFRSHSLCFLKVKQGRHRDR